VCIDDVERFFASINDITIILRVREDCVSADARQLSVALRSDSHTAAQLRFVVLV